MRAAALLALLVVPSPASAGEILVSAAASLADAMGEISAAFEKDTGHRVRLNLAGSNTLAAQISRGAPVDLFFSADESRMDLLERKGLLVARSRRSLLSNALVIIVPRSAGETIEGPADLARTTIRRLAIADPEAVPGGIYSKKMLEHAGIWDAVAHKVIPTDDVRACLAAVASGAADAGIVYRTDAQTSTAVTIAWEVPPDRSPTISYPVALVTNGRSPAAARALLEYLVSPEAGSVFERWGFIVR